MTVWTIYFILGIGLTIGNYLFLPKKYDKEAIMQCIHITFTVPSSYYLSEGFIQHWAMPDNLMVALVLTLTLVCLSLSSWRIIVHRFGEK